MNSEFYQTFKELTPTLLIFWKIQVRRTFPNLVSEASIIMTPKLGEKKKTKLLRKNYRPISLTNIDDKNLNKILANWIQQHITRLIQIKWYLSLGYKKGSRYTNQLMYCITSIEWKKMITWSSQERHKKHLTKLNIFTW